MEGFYYPKFILQQGDYICKLDLKDAYFQSHCTVTPGK